MEKMWSFAHRWHSTARMSCYLSICGVFSLYCKTISSYR